MMRTFIFYFTLSKCFFDFLIILVTHVFLSNKKPGKPLIVRAFPAFPGQSPTVSTTSLFLTFILLGYTHNLPDTRSSRQTLQASAGCTDRVHGSSAIYSVSSVCLFFFLLCFSIRSSSSYRKTKTPSMTPNIRIVVITLLPP